MFLTLRNPILIEPVEVSLAHKPPRQRASSAALAGFHPAQETLPKRSEEHVPESWLRRESERRLCGLVAEQRNDIVVCN